MSFQVAVDDAGAVTADMLRRPRRRELGPALHRRNHREAREKILAQLAYLLRLAEDPSPGSPPQQQH